MSTARFTARLDRSERITTVTFSTDRPDGTPIPRNVSREADSAFMAELKRTDRARFDRLQGAIMRDGFRATQQQKQQEQLQMAA